MPVITQVHCIVWEICSVKGCYYIKLGCTTVWDKISSTRPTYKWAISSSSTSVEMFPSLQRWPQSMLENMVIRKHLSDMLLSKMGLCSRLLRKGRFSGPPSMCGGMGALWEEDKRAKFVFFLKNSPGSASVAHCLPLRSSREAKMTGYLAKLSAHHYCPSFSMKTNM